MGLFNHQHKYRDWVLGANDSNGVRDVRTSIVGVVPDRESPRAHDAVTSGDAAAAAGWIAAGVMAFITAIVKLRSWWSSESRQIRYDQSSIDWQADREKEIDDMRKQINAMWGHKVDDAKRLSELDSENRYLKERVAFLEQRIAVLEAQGGTP